MADGLFFCATLPHSQTAEEAIHHWYKQERKCLTPVRSQLSRTQALFGRVTPGVCAGVGDQWRTQNGIWWSFVFGVRCL